MAGALLSPNSQSIRPEVEESEVPDLLYTIFGVSAVKIEEMQSYDDRNYKITTQEGRLFVFKVLNSMDTVKPHVDAELACLEKLHEKGIQCPVAVRSKNGNYKEVVTLNSGTSNLIRLLTFLPGKVLLGVKYSQAVLVEVGDNLGKINLALHDWSHPALNHHQTVWNLSLVPQLREFCHVLDEEWKNELIEEVISNFSKNVVPAMESFKKGVIHGDYNDQNILVDEYAHICGVIDFGDMTYSYYLFEVAIAIMYLMVESTEIPPAKVGGYVLHGYCKHIHLNERELRQLKYCIAGRFAQSLVLGAYSYSCDPTNEYLLITAKRGWNVLREFWDITEEDIYHDWKEIEEKLKLEQKTS